MHRHAQVDRSSLFIKLSTNCSVDAADQVLIKAGWRQQVSLQRLADTCARAQQHQSERTWRRLSTLQGSGSGQTALRHGRGQGLMQQQGRPVHHVLLH